MNNRYTPQGDPIPRRKKRNIRIPYPKVGRKFTARVKGKTENNRILFFKTRSKNPEQTIRRFATRNHFSIQRITT